LFPLYLEHYLKIDCIKWLSNYIHGIPVEVTAKLLPWKSKWSLGVRLHVMLQNNMRRRKTSHSVHPVFSKQKLLNLITHLESIIRPLASGYPSVSTWSNYYDETILGKEYLDQKEIILKKFLGALTYKSVLDLGANDGYFSRLLAKENKMVLAIDSDSRCINNLYQLVKREQLKNIVPLIIDFSNPSPAIGFSNTERSSFEQRAKVDLVLALALIHHLVISKNIPLPDLAEHFAGMAPQLIIEFVPKEDEKVKQLLSGRADIFSTYDVASFEAHFSRYYTIQAKELIPGTTRILYCLVRK
jgi:2-polyprenyl-3-methyl-5-hydroxy-6-metoxy-1,4-benzoquinol methylase